MDYFYYFAFVFLLLFTYHLYSIQFSTRKLPPGPFMFPLGLGIIPYCAVKVDNVNIFKPFEAKPWEALDFLQKKFGDFMSVEVGPFYTVVISSYEILKEVANFEEYSMKFAHEFFTYSRTFNKELGLVFQSKYEEWTEMRKFTQRVLREFGFGKRHTMQSAIDAETSALVKNFNDAIKNQEGILKVRSNFVLSIVNVLWCMVAGQRYEHDDPRLVKMMERNLAMTKSVTFAEPMHIIFAFVNKIFPSAFNEGFRLKAFQECHAFTQMLVEERKAEGIYKTEPQNYIDVFLKKIDDGKATGDEIYTEQQLQAMLADLLQAGSTTTNGTLNYAFLYLILNPDVQKKCQAEIDFIVPRHLTPTLEDIEKMPYFQAFVLEVHRLGNIVPNPVPRLAPKDWNYRGYKIPKGAVIFSNHYSVHMDEKYWGDPHVFRPSRFINSAGEFVPDKRVIHFGFGKRMCIGITLANSVIPIFISTLLQNFNFSIVPGTKPPSTEPEIGVSLSPMEYPMLVTNRDSSGQLRKG